MKRQRLDKNPKEILFLLNSKGWTFADVDRVFGLLNGIARNAARRPHFDGEMAIAEALSLSPRQIWPSRFNAKTGERLRPQPAENYTTRPQWRSSQKRCAA